MGETLTPGLALATSWRASSVVIRSLVSGRRARIGRSRCNRNRREMRRPVKIKTIMVMQAAISARVDWGWLERYVHSKPAPSTIDAIEDRPAIQRTSALDPLM